MGVIPYLTNTDTLALAHKGHVAFDNIDKLKKLIHGCSPDEPASSCTGVVSTLLVRWVRGWRPATKASP